MTAADRRSVVWYLTPAGAGFIHQNGREETLRRTRPSGGLRRLSAAPAQGPLEADRRGVGDQGANQAAPAPGTAAAAHRPQPDRDRLADLRPFGAGGDVGRPHHPRDQDLVEDDDAVALRDPQPQVEVGGIAVARVVAAGRERDLAAEGGGAVRDRVEPHQRAAHIPGGEAGSQAYRAPGSVHLPRPYADHGDVVIRVERRELALEPLRLGVVVGVLDRDD